MSADRPISILELPAQPEAPLRLTPRSVEACGREGVEIRDLVYRPIESFVERTLAPRLIKLRYDFYEAKRRDLIDAIKKTRESVPLSTRRSPPPLPLVSPGQSSDKWLTSVLRHELASIEELERDNEMLSADEEAQQAKMRAESQRLKELNDKRHAEEETKQQELEVRMRVERQRAREEFERQQRELQDKQTAENAKRQEVYEKSLRDMEQRRQYELEKQRKLREMFAHKQRALKALGEREADRTRIRLHRETIKKQQLRDSMEKRVQRWQKSKENNMHLDIVRRENFLRQLNNEQQREERLTAQREEDKERSARRQLALLLKRKSIMHDAEKKAEERRLVITQQQESIEERLRTYAQKRDKFLGFKRELEHLKDVNKQLNVQRQRKREDFKREQIAQDVQAKDLKVHSIRSHKLKVWTIKRQKAAHERLVRETVKSTVMDMRIKSKVDSNKIKQLILKLTNTQHTTTPPADSASGMSAPVVAEVEEFLPGDGDSPQFARAVPDDLDDGSDDQ